MQTTRLGAAAAASASEDEEDATVGMSCPIASMTKARLASKEPSPPPASAAPRAG
jgi:hypothetical protein